jgi:PRTRC genetic system ThiF family protein
MIISRRIMMTLTELNLGLLRAKAVVTPGGENRLLKLVLVGCGGTGSWLAGGIARVAWELKRMGRQVEVQFWDFDRVGSQNVPRQCFAPCEIGLFKAETLALRYGAAWGINIAAYLQPFDPSRLQVKGYYYSHNQPLTILLGAVDNANARRRIAATLENNNRQAPSTWWMDTGNSKSSCQVLIGTHNRVEELQEAFTLSCNALPSPVLQHPELLEPLPEELPGAGGKLSCAELVAANAQSMTINKLASSLAEDMLIRLLTGKLNYFAVYADQESGTARAHYTNPCEVAAVIGKTQAFFTTGR